MNENQYQQLREYDRKNLEANIGRTAIGCSLLMLLGPLVWFIVMVTIVVSAILSIR